ncbi:MAG: DUF3037 domain-containing protein [Candidatus Melainabacteria bacterium HGW-Melainabacteria-1]|nr:MAG: DUF3037 domain-containing protein [Candidatus Melainabacteria bacterium HGW-Melainabacteria-1]
MPTVSFEYAIIRVVPRVERQEFINVGVVLSCRAHRFLSAEISCDRARLMAFAPSLDLDLVESYLATIPTICEGSGGPLAPLPQQERFHWLVAPRSTIIQLSPVHSGLCESPRQELARLMTQMVHPR